MTQQWYITAHCKPLMSVLDIMSLAGVSRVAVWKWIHEGKLDAYRMGGMGWLTGREQVVSFLNNREAEHRG